MASWNLFSSSREKKAIESIAQEIQSSEAPTGAIGKLSSKVRGMVADVAARVRWFVGGSWDAAKAAVLAAAAAAAPPMAHAGENMQPNQPLGSNLQWSASAKLDDGSRLVLSGGAIQYKDKVGVTLWAEKSDAESAVGGFVTIAPWINQVGIVAAGRWNYPTDGYGKNMSDSVFRLWTQAQDARIKEIKEQLKQQYIAEGLMKNNPQSAALESAYKELKQQLLQNGMTEEHAEELAKKWSYDKAKETHAKEIEAYADERAEKEANQQRELFGTTYSGGLILNQTDAREVFGPNVGRWPLNAASLVFSSSTNISSTTSSASDTLINLHARYDKTFDEILSSRESNQVVTRIEDLSDRIKTWTDTTTTILNQEYRGLNRWEIRTWVSHKFNDHHAVTAEVGGVRMETPSGISKENSGFTSNIGYMYASDKGNARLGVSANPNGDLTYSANVSFQPVKESPVAAEIFASKTESQDNAVVGVGFKWRIGGNGNPNPTQVAQLTGRTPEGLVKEFGYIASNPSMFQFEKGEIVNTKVTWPVISKLVSTEMKNIVSNPVITAPNSLSFVSGKPGQFSVTFSGATSLDLSQTGNILPTKISESVAADGSKTYIIQVTSTSDVATTGTVILRAGTIEKVIDVSVMAANKPPIANSDADVTDWSTPIDVDLIANDQDPEGETLTLTNVSVDPTQGSASIVNGKLHFVPKVNVAGAIAVSYTVQDAQGNTSTGRATITVKKPSVIEIGVSTPAVSIQQANTDASEPITLTTSQNVTASNIRFSLPPGVTMVPRQAVSLKLASKSPRSLPLPQQAVGFAEKSFVAEPEPKNTLDYNIVVSPNARVGTHNITATITVDGVVKEVRNLFALTVEAKAPQNSDTILSAPGVSFTGDQGVTLVNNLSDADGIDNLVYIIVDANGEKIQNSSPDIKSLKPGNYTAYTQALAYNPSTKRFALARSATVSFSIATPDTPASVGAPDVVVNGQSIVATNNISDVDGVVDISYIVVGPNGFQIPRLDGDFSNLPPGNYTLFTKARTRNATTGEYTDVVSPQTSFVILPTDSKPVLTPPSVLKGTLSASLINNITDSDGISNLVYIIVDANGNEMVSSSSSFPNLKSGSYSAYTQALAYNPNTGTSDLVSSERTPFTVDAIDTETTFNGAPQYSVDQSARSVRVTDAGAMDSDGIVGYQYYLIAPGVRIANTDGNFSNLLPGTYTLEVDVSGVDGATGAVKVATNPNKPTITIETPKVDAPTVMTQITGVKISDNSFQITSSGISDADGEIVSLLYVATNTRTGQQLSSANGRFDNLDWGDWVVIATGTANDGATGALKSVKNTDSDKVYRFTREEPDTLAPTLTLNGASELRLTVGDVYTELGVQALDNKDGDISSSVQTSGLVDTNTPGTYTIIYTVADKAGNTTSATRSVTVLAPKVDAPTTYAEPLLSVNQDTNTVSIKNMGDLVKDLDGVKDVTVYLEANGVRIGNSQGLYANVLTSTSADVAYTISADYLAKNGITGKYEPGTHTFTTKAVLNKEAPADTTPPSKVSEDLLKIDFPAETNSGTITLSEEASRVVWFRYIDSTWANMIGFKWGAMSVGINPSNRKELVLKYTVPDDILNDTQVLINVVDDAGNEWEIMSNKYNTN